MQFRNAYRRDDRSLTETIDNVYTLDMLALHIVRL